MLVVAGALIAILGLFLSVMFVRDTAEHMALEQALENPGRDAAAPTLRTAFANASYRVPALRSCSQAGLVNNLNDGLAWGLVPLFLAAHGASAAQVGLVAALYPRCLGRRADRHRPLVRPDRAQTADRRRHARPGRRARPPRRQPRRPRHRRRRRGLLGAGTALVYPTLIAAISDAVTPVARAPVVGVYRFWRDMGYVCGGLIAGLTADALGYGGAITLVAALTATSGLWVLHDMPTDRRDRHPGRDPTRHRPSEQASATETSKA